MAAAGLLAGCGKSTEGDSPVAFQAVTGDQFTANPGAFQTDGIAAPPSGVTMVGNIVAAQAKARLTLALRRPGDDAAVNRIDTGMVNEETFDKLLQGLNTFELPDIPGLITASGPAKAVEKK